MKMLDTRTIGGIAPVLILAILVFAGFTLNASAQSTEDKQVREVLTKNSTAFAQTVGPICCVENYLC